MGSNPSYLLKIFFYILCAATKNKITGMGIEISKMKIIWNMEYGIWNMEYGIWIVDLADLENLEKIQPSSNLIFPNL